MKSRIVSEKDLATAINMLMAGNIPASTSDVLNLVQCLQRTPVAPEPEQERLTPTPVAPEPEQTRPPKMEVVRDDV